MKNKRTTYFGVVLTLLLSGFLFLQGCESSRVGPDIPRPNPPAPPAAPSPILLTGQVLDSQSGAGIGKAQVALTTIAGVAITSTESNSAGTYTFDVSERTETQLNVNVVAPGYGVTSRVATIDKAGRLAFVAPATLSKLQAITVAVTAASGGTATTPVTQQSENSTPVTLSIPPAAVSGTTNISVAPVPVINTPPAANPATSNDVSTASLTPAGITFLKPVDLSFPLPYPLPQGTTIPVLRLNTGTNRWETTTLNATVNASTIAAIVQITQTGEYGLLGSVGLTEQAAGSYVSGDLSIKVEELQKSTSPEAERIITFKGAGTQTISLPFSVTRTLTQQTGVNVSDNFLRNLKEKILKTTFTQTNVPYTFSFPGFPAAYIRNGVQFNPNNPNEAGEWEYRVYMIDRVTSRIVNIQHVGIFTRIFRVEMRTWERDAARTGWYWIAHNQGGVAQGPF
ncbi:MAG: hypothetical protein KF816_12805 [Melioribacteraceae bacterium]|nr:hypothetical protein [Melioribacteraceae bacterium]